MRRPDPEDDEAELPWPPRDYDLPPRADDDVAPADDDDPIEEEDDADAAPGRDE
jgi:hypothetical protein